MSDTTITLSIYSNGNLISPSSVEVEDQTAAYGVRRIDNDAVVVNAGTDLTEGAVGTFEIIFADPAPLLQYEYTFKIVYLGQTYYRTFSANMGTITNTLIIPSTEYITSQSEVYRILGNQGAQQMEDDIVASERGPVWEQILGEVHDTFLMYLQHYYETANLLTSRWVRTKATILATNRLTSRRGNPGLYTDDLPNIYEQLEAIRSGMNFIPDVEQRGYFGPAIRNYELEMQRGYHPLRVEKTMSMGSSYSREDMAWEYPFWF